MRAIDRLNARPRLVGCAAVALSCLYVAIHLPSGWIPHDEGQLGQAAERTLRGELPHRDFDDMYTGGLSFLHAAASRWWGVDSASLRVMLGLFFVPTLAAYFYLASRVLSPLWAALLTLLGAMMSLPTYSAPMPSWYNLFFAIIGAAALVRYVETDYRRWLFAAGICGGLSIVIKITGLYFVAAGLLFLVYREQLLDQTLDRSERNAERQIPWYSWALALGLVAFGGLGLAFVRSGRPEMNLIHFTAPMVGLAAFLLVREGRGRYGPSAVRWKQMARMAVPFTVGVAIPPAMLVGYYALHSAIGDLYEGVFVLPRMRVESGVFPLPPFQSFIITGPLAFLLVLGQRPPGPGRKAIEFAALGAMVLLLLASGTEVGFHIAFSTIRNALPLLVLVALWMLVDERSVELSTTNRQWLFIASTVAAMAGLVQYPHAYGIYFFYVAPLVVLLGGYIAALQQFPLRRAMAGLAVFYVAFAALQLNGPDPHRNVGWRATARAMEPMHLDRCALTVPTDEAHVYRSLIEVVQAHSSADSYILAGPDCPEVYYLSNRLNPSRVMYEFFRPAWFDEPKRLFETLDRRKVKVVVMNWWPSFSKKIPKELGEAIAARFPHQQAILMVAPDGQTTIERFRVFWRD